MKDETKDNQIVEPEQRKPVLPGDGPVQKSAEDERPPDIVVEN